MAPCSSRVWKPKRTILICAWDGEEPGLLGSTEWAETHAEELQRNGAVYINSDGKRPRIPGRGRFAHARKVRQHPWRAMSTTRRSR